MQKPQVKQLTIQATYTNVEVGLFNNGRLVAKNSITKYLAASQLIPSINQLLRDQDWQLLDLDFICSNLGPAPFTTLRTAIATVNGLAFATKIPLVGVSGLEVFTKNVLPHQKCVVIIWNAFGASAYYGVRTLTSLDYSWMPIEKLLLRLKTEFNNLPVTICGQGTAFFADQLANLPSNFSLDKDPQNHFPTLESIGDSGLRLFLDGCRERLLTPIYLKQAEPISQTT